jgi:hypothetical protein
LKEILNKKTLVLKDTGFHNRLVTSQGKKKKKLLIILKNLLAVLVLDVSGWNGLTSSTFAEYNDDNFPLKFERV